MPISAFSAFWNKKRSGFTLLEMMISVSVLVILSGIMIGYSRTAVKGLALANQETGILNLLFHAKTLSSTFSAAVIPGSQICSYGVHVDTSPVVVNGITYNGQAFVFYDLVSRPDSNDYCDTSYSGKHVYNQTPADERMPGAINTFYLDNAFDFTAATDLSDIVFIPPDPKVIINEPTRPDLASVVVVNNADPNINFTIEVNNFGQISAN